jgi:hypothetical protein
MRPLVYGFATVLIVMLVVAIGVLIQLSTPNTAIGVHAIAAITLTNPLFWVLYVAGFAAAYFLAAR